jgi:group I intron endonuclease
MHIFPNNKVYIGLTGISIEDRWKNGKGYNTQSLIKYAILKYGWENVKHEILEVGLTKNEAIQSEIFYIKKYKSNDREFGYNISLGGEGAGMHSEESKAKMSRSRKGRKASQETREKMSKSFKGHPVPAEARKKMSDSKKGIPHPREESCKKPVLQYDISTGEFIKRYSSINEASIELGIQRGHIGECVQRKRRQSGNSVWVYESEIKNGVDVNAIIEKSQKNSLFKPVGMFDPNGNVVKHFSHTKSASLFLGVSECTIRRYIKSNIVLSEGDTLAYAI